VCRRVSLEIVPLPDPLWRSTPGAPERLGITSAEPSSMETTAPDSCCRSGRSPKAALVFHPEVRPRGRNKLRGEMKDLAALGDPELKEVIRSTRWTEQVIERLMRPQESPSRRWGCRCHLTPCGSVAGKHQGRRMSSLTGEKRCTPMPKSSSTGRCPANPGWRTPLYADLVTNHSQAAQPAEARVPCGACRTTQTCGRRTLGRRKGEGACLDRS